MCVLCYVWDNRYRRSLREDSPRELHLSGRNAQEDRFPIALKLQALKCERLIDSNIQAELTPPFSQNVLPSWGWISLSCLWLNLMLEECEHTSRPICCINAPFISEMCCLEDKMRSEMTLSKSQNQKLKGWKKSEILNVVDVFLPDLWRLRCRSASLPLEGEFSQMKCLAEDGSHSVLLHTGQVGKWGVRTAKVMHFFNLDRRTLSHLLTCKKCICFWELQQKWLWDRLNKRKKERRKQEYKNWPDKMSLWHNSFWRRATISRCFSPHLAEEHEGVFWRLEIL